MIAFLPFVKARHAMCCIALALAACGGGEQGVDGNPAFVTSGRWLDATGAPIPGAVAKVQLDKEYSAVTGADGGFELKIPQDYKYPEVFAGSISKPGYLPTPIFFTFIGSNRSSSVEGKSIQTRATTVADVVYSSGIGVTHLGDDSFGGSANSQLQLAAVGTFWIDRFVLSAEQKSKFKSLCIAMSARGVQSTSNEDLISLSRNGAPGSYLVNVMSDSDTSGGYSQITTCFSIATFAANDTIQLQINSGNKRGSDYDDFEFTNVLGVLKP